MQSNRNLIRSIHDKIILNVLLFRFFSSTMGGPTESFLFDLQKGIYVDEGEDVSSTSCGKASSPYYTITRKDDPPKRYSETSQTPT